ncbi:hypothetical protein LTS15_003721 [Exophiala xenobiotica]|nr:hypothetical protein LTS15_003721 [Exophiala xenobiotica]
MTDRRNMIEGRVIDFGETYQWIFSRQAGKYSWDGRHGFVKWLRTGTEVFWISGKPGSGKSTLMDFIYQNLQPNGLGFAHLEKWAASKPVRLLSFWFFRPATSMLLKSLQGFWRSLCFQILDNDRVLVDNIQRDAGHSVPVALKSCLQVQGSHNQSWTDAELKSWFIYLITHSGYHYCLLVDGLDEVAGNRQALLDAVQEIALSSKKIKICCSSRPEAPFAGLLRRYPSLRLQDFNFGDIENHCRTRLDGTGAVVYADTIASRAEGVFLWAYLVAEDLRTAVNQGDTEEDLNSRLEECPGGMNELFKFLLERQDKFYAKHPKPYLHLLDVASKKEEHVTVLELFIASEDQDKVRSCFPVNLEDGVDYLAALNNSAVDLEANLVARCAGLVECKNAPHVLEFPDTYSYKNLSRTRVMVVRFIHRSARDFLLESESGRALLQSCSISEQDALKRLTTALALLFLADSNEQWLRRPLRYASCLHDESWTPFETSMADDLFSAQHHREPFHDQYRSYEMCCLQLSPWEDIASYAATYLEMTAYLATKLTDYEPTKSSLVAGISMCYYINNERKIFGEPNADFIGMLQPYLCHARTLTLQCKFRTTAEWDPSYYVAARPLWQHLYLALTTAFFRLGRDRRKSQEASSICDSIFSSCKGEEPDLECRILLTLGGAMARIVPAPDDDNDDDDGAVLNRTDTCRYGSFKVRMAVHGFTELSGSSVDFLQYSPGGLDRFFDVEPSVNKSLRIAFDRSPLQETFTRLDRATTNCITAFLNGHLDDMSSSEVAKVVCFQDHRDDQYHMRDDGGLCFIFSKGRIHATIRGERKEWERRLKAGIFDPDFETDPEHDPILISATSSVHSDEDTVSDDEGAVSSTQNGRTGNDNQRSA